MNREPMRWVAAPLIGLLFLAVLVTWQLQSGFDAPPEAPPSLAARSADAGSEHELRFESGVTGVANGAEGASTEESIAGDTGDVILAAVASKPAQPIGSVEGLGLEWFHVRTQCSGRGTTELSLWAAVADMPYAGPITVELASGSADLAMFTARYSGVDTGRPVGSIAGANSNGEPETCEGGADGFAYEVDLQPTAPNSRTVVVAATRQSQVVTPPSLVERGGVRTAGDGTAAGLTFGDDVLVRTVFRSIEPSRAARSFVGTLTGEADWAAIAVELYPDGSGPQAPTIRLSETRVDFGVTRSLPGAGEVVISRTIEVGNDGVDDLVIRSIEVDGPDADQFAVSGSSSFVVEQGATHEVTLEFRPDREANASAVARVVSSDSGPAEEVDLAGRGGPLPHGIWISAAELASRPMEGNAWEQLEAAADGELGDADVSNFVNDHDARTLAVALVYARTGDDKLRDKARSAIAEAIGTEDGTTTAVQPCRNVAPYVIAADLIDLPDLDRELDSRFGTWIDEIRFVEWPDGSFIDEDEERANNHGRMCGMSRATIAAYLGDEAEVAAAADAFARFLGDTTTADESVWKHDLSWQADPGEPVGINPVGALKDGLSIDGALPEEMRRGGPFGIPPQPTGYPWEALQGVVVEAVVLDRAGYDVFDWSDRAILRAVEFLDGLDESFPAGSWWAEGDDTWVPWVVNDIYGTDFSTKPANIGKSMGWTDWTHAPS